MQQKIVQLLCLALQITWREWYRYKEDNSTRDCNQQHPWSASILKYWRGSEDRRYFHNAHDNYVNINVASETVDR